MSNYCTTARQGAKNDRDYGARHRVLRDSIVLHHGCVLAYGQRAPRAPHRKCREPVAGILTENCLVTYPGFVPVRTGHVSEPATSFFSRNSSDRPPASDSRGALQSLNVRGESAYPNTPDPRRYCLASATSSTTFASRSVPNTLVLALIHACGAMFTLCARAIAGRVALSAAHCAVFEPLTYHTTPATIQ